MLDIKKIRDDPEAVKAAGRKKRIPVDAEVDSLLELDRRVRALKHERETLKAEQNRTGKEIARLAGADKEARIRDMAALARLG